MLYQNNSETILHVDGVTILSNKTLKHLATKMQSTSEIIIYVEIKLSNKLRLCIIQVHASTRTSEIALLNNGSDRSKLVFLVYH